MGFWEMAGFALFQAIREMKQEEEQDWQELHRYFRLTDAEESFMAFKNAAGFTNAFYCVDWNSVDLGASAVNEEIRKMDAIKLRMRYFTELGGQPEYVDDLDDIEEYICKVNYLGVVGYLDRQEDFLVFDFDDMVKYVQTDMELKQMEEDWGAD